VAAAVLFVLAWVQPLGAQIVVNELYYDHPGADAGFEFVELLNVSSGAVPLAEVVLQFHNGTGTDWSDIWRGSSGAILPGSLFVVGGDGVRPVPDTVVPISLQNGPDAVRVVVAGIPADRVGYGGLDTPGYAEVRSAPDADPGMSVARIPDGVDSDDNGADFHAVSPSPGGFNVPRVNLRLATAPGTALRRALSGPGAETLVLAVHNTGTRAVPPAAARLAVSDSSVTGTAAIAEVVLDGIDAGAVATVAVDVVLQAGYHRIRAALVLPGDERPGDDAFTLLRRAGGTGILVSEIHASAASGCPQFVELYNASSQARDLAGYQLRDRSHAPVRISREALILAPGAALAITSDRAALLVCHPDAPADNLHELAGSWPTLNRTGTPIADSVVVTDPFALPADAVGYPAPAAGLSLERVTLFENSPSVWVVSGAPNGATPGRPGVRAVSRIPARGTVTVAPNPFDPWAGETLRVVVADAPGAGRVTARVFAASGRGIADLGTAAALPAVFIWDGQDLTGARVLPGVFIVTCEFNIAGGGRRVEKVVVGCVGRKD